MIRIIKKALYFLLVVLVVSIASCDRHILKKLKKDQDKDRKENLGSSVTDTEADTFKPGNDLTGYPRKNGKRYQLASLKKTPCLGECSAYEAKLYSDGSTTFFGRKNVNLKGRFESRITAQQMKELVARIQVIAFFNFDKNYLSDEQNSMSNNSKTITTIQLGDQINKVSTNGAGPEALLAFENYLDELFDRLDWVAK